MQPEYPSPNPPMQPAPPLAPPQSFDMPPNPSDKPSKKVIILFVGGVLVVLAIIAWLLFGGKTPASQQDMRVAVENTSNSLGIVDAYADQLTYSDTKNKIALTQTLLRGAYQDMNDVYNKTYKPKKKFAANPKPDDASQERLDAAKRSNQLDSEIIKVLQPKVVTATNSLKAAIPSFTKKDTIQKLKAAQANLEAADSLLSQP